ncbi:MAG: hypothetical protein KZQ63_19285, partial [Candidatus Thiodiazotropha sp. (ex Lucinoma aequizonata)]|nr:hypothetical protein [Candidatus Thiodiazotropha sp. (ex Lucinoma aequizonata)]MCU7913898.1 hypothetical protein [Candidatus Thiodiazotropha sp. (ex Lucinoma aequizonata)]
LQLWVDHFAHGDFTGRRFMGFVVFVALQHYILNPWLLELCFKNNELSNSGHILLFVAALFFDVITVV